MIATEVQTEPVVEAIAASTKPIESDSEAGAKAFIYFKESSNRLDNVNSIGCYGLGQDCNNVLASECPDWRTNYACQDNFWNNYAIRRYGSWVAAMNHWLARVPINGKDVGNWW